ncbi:hypothetical protein [Hymenobacter terrigena]
MNGPVFHVGQLVVALKSYQSRTGAIVKGTLYTVGWIQWQHEKWYYWPEGIQDGWTAEYFAPVEPLADEVLAELLAEAWEGVPA